MQSHDYSDIYESVTGFVSLGTPFDGFSAERGLHQVFETVAMSQIRTESTLIESLARRDHRDSEVLINIVQEFTRDIITRSSPPPICCFFEEKHTRFGTGIVPGLQTELVGDYVPLGYDLVYQWAMTTNTTIGVRRGRIIRNFERSPQIWSLARSL